MASTIKLKNGSGAPTTGDLVQGEPALDLTNKRLYTENASGVVIEVGTNPSTIDINAGTIDGTVIGGSTAAAITGTTITGTSFVSSGDMTFEDNDKAVFGDGSDLRIYHTGSHSTIENIGSGHLQITQQQDFRPSETTAGTESMILANADGNVQLFYDNAEKLATTATGIDVTGTVTADGLDCQMVMFLLLEQETLELLALIFMALLSTTSMWMALLMLIKCLLEEERQKSEYCIQAATSHSMKTQARLQSSSGTQVKRGWVLGRLVHQYI
jgi:hypothetical protein